MLLLVVLFVWLIFLSAVLSSSQPWPIITTALLNTHLCACLLTFGCCSPLRSQDCYLPSIHVRKPVSRSACPHLFVTPPRSCVRTEEHSNVELQSQQFCSTAHAQSIPVWSVQGQRGTKEDNEAIVLSIHTHTIVPPLSCDMCTLFSVSLFHWIQVVLIAHL